LISTSVNGRALSLGRLGTGVEWSMNVSELFSTFRPRLELAIVFRVEVVVKECVRSLL